MAVATSNTITATTITISISVDAVRANFVKAKPITIQDSNLDSKVTEKIDKVARRPRVNEQRIFSAL